MRELGRHDTDHGVHLMVELDVAANDAAIPSEPPLPQL